VTRAILTCSPYFASLALNELRRSQPDITVLQHLAPGYVFLQTSASFDQLTAPWRKKLPIYLHHLAPVQVTVALAATRHDLTVLKNTMRLRASTDAAIQARSTLDQALLPYSMDEVREVLSGKKTRPRPMPPTGRIVSILIAQRQTGLEAYMGISWARQNLSPWAGGQIPITEPVANRAGYKLLEALTAFGIRVRRGDIALDLGAAPGAWTTLLRRRGLHVTAVAPTPLYPWLLYDAGVQYQSLRAEDYLPRCTSTFALIVNDMKLDAQDSARLMVEYTPHLRSEGIAIMTLKLRDRNQKRVMDHAFRLLRKTYKIIRVRQLVSNRSEVTLFLRRET
jgi:23S rRNA (cytidine2498-2'-O)-methyltransferase